MHPIETTFRHIFKRELEPPAPVVERKPVFGQTVKKEGPFTKVRLEEAEEEAKRLEEELEEARMKVKRWTKIEEQAAKERAMGAPW